MRYQVETRTLCQGWINCWMVDDQPETFATLKEAQQELEDFLNDIQFEIDSGDRAADEGYDPEDFRITEVPFPDNPD